MLAVAAFGRVSAHIRIVFVFALTADPVILDILRRALGLRYVLGLRLRGNLFPVWLLARPAARQLMTLAEISMLLHGQMRLMW